MKLKTILLTFVFAGKVFAQQPELPVVNQYMLMGVLNGVHQNGQPCMSLGYDTNGDGHEDTRFHYMLRPVSQYQAQAQLDSYAIDLNGDHQFSEDEWFVYSPRREEPVPMPEGEKRAI